jgi:hypothetical protein
VLTKTQTSLRYGGHVEFAMLQIQNKDFNLKFEEKIILSKVMSFADYI